MQITTLGIDVAKKVFQLHGVDARGRAVLSRRVTRQQLLDTVANLPACVIGMEACGSAQHWGRASEQLGHTVTLMHPKQVSPTSRPTSMMGAMRRRAAKRWADPPCALCRSRRSNKPTCRPCIARDRSS